MSCYFMLLLLAQLGVLCLEDFVVMFHHKLSAGATRWIEIMFPRAQDTW